MDDYHKVVKKRYDEEAQTSELSLKSTMPDLNTRRLEIQSLIKHLDDDESCLEVGCGNGAASLEISKIKKINLLSTDINQEMIKLANKQSNNYVKGSIEFRQCSVLDLDFDEAFDTVFSTRCVINLMLWKDQKVALEKMARSIKNNGKLILLEAFSDGLDELNEARSEFELGTISPAYHNLHLKKEDVISVLGKHNCVLEDEDNFLSSYFFGSRVIYPALSKALDIKMKKNSKIDLFFSNMPSIGNFAHIKILKFRKKI